MKCKHPFIKEDLGIMLPCGQCLFCRISKRNKWTARMMLEMASHKSAVFTTLTYADEFLPSPASVSKRELQLFFKRLRKRLGDVKLRYYACGEYGDEKGRPHYHAIIYGLDMSHHPLIFEAWNKGRVETYPASPQTMAYVCGYVAKKYVKNKDDLDAGLNKEFALMSRRPALGSGALDALASQAFLQNPYDVLSVIRVGGKNLPLDRTMRSKLRNLVMSEEEQEHIKNLRIELMKEQLLEFIGETYQDASFREKVLWKQNPAYFGAKAHEDANFKDLDAKERIITRRNARKDL